MAKIGETVFRKYVDGQDRITALEYTRERELLRLAINDLEDRFEVAGIDTIREVTNNMTSLNESINKAISDTKSLNEETTGQLGDIKETVNELRLTGTGIDAQARKEVQVVSEELTNKVSKGEVSIRDIDKNRGLIDETYLSDELKQQMAGDTPIHAVPANYSLTESKFAFPVLAGKRGNNLFNKETVTKGYYINPTGQLVAAPAWAVSDFMDVTPGSKVYFTPTSFSCFYNDNKEVVPGGATTITSPLTIPANVTKIKLGYNLIHLDKAMVNMGDRLLPYEPYGAKFDPAKIENKTISKDKLDFIALEGAPSDNLFNKETVTKGYYIGANGNLVPNPNWAVSDFIPSESLEKYSFSPTSFMAYYNSGMTFKSKLDTITSPITTPEDTSYFRICCKIPDLDTFMVNKGDSLLPYEPYDVVKLASTPKKSLEIIVPYNVYTVANDIVKTPVFERNYVANLVIDHMININEYNKDIHFKDKGVSFPFYAPFINDGTDTGYVINKGKTVNKESVKLEFESKDFHVSTKQVNHISTKASVGKEKKIFQLTIGDSLTNDHLSGSNRIDEIKPGQMVYWASVKRYFELDKIDAGDSPNEYNLYMLGKKTRKSIPISYKGKTRTVTANGEGYGGWSLYSILRHQDRINGSQTTWDLLGLGDGSGTDYTGSQEQRDLIGSTNQIFTGTPVNPFFDNNKSGPNRFSLKKYLERFRTMDDNGNRLTLGNGTGTEITAANINSIDVCTPTHIVLQMGANDLGRTSASKFLSNLKEFVNTIRSEYPTIIIGISLTPDYAGTYFPAKYPEFDNCKIDRTGHNLHYQSAKLILDWFKDKDEATEKLFLIPSFFVQPNAYSMPYIKYNNPESESDELLKNKGYLVKYGAGPDIHPNYNAHVAWAYQIYSWLKYTLSL